MLEQGREELFFKVVRAAFGQRRKTLVNALSAGLTGTLGKDEITDAVVTCGFDAMIRGEALSLPEFIKLTDAIRQML